jgi:farnesyl-diphosphate farnesyltransferase
VSRTFALTIPQLPPKLADAVTNAYLLCRIVDTIEDEPTLSFTQKHYFCQRLINVVAGQSPPEQFAAELTPQLSDRVLPAERELIEYTPQVLGITQRLNERQQKALFCCIQQMAQGMVEFQQNSSLHGLKDLPHLDRYCYYVAGIVGEMLTKLFCDYSAEIAQHRSALMKLAVSFGQGLQMTNILKDIWDDQQRGICWLPRDIFSRAGFDLQELTAAHYRNSFGQGLTQLIGIAHGHLHNALIYTLVIPKHETGIRRFCLLALGMAVLTLRKLKKHRVFCSGIQVKISRRSVKATVFTSHLTASHNSLLRTLFYLASIGLPTPYHSGS